LEANLLSMNGADEKRGSQAQPPEIRSASMCNHILYICRTARYIRLLFKLFLT
jgi:hypothetical protein